MFQNEPFATGDPGGGAGVAFQGLSQSSCVSHHLQFHFPCRRYLQALQRGTAVPLVFVQFLFPSPRGWCRSDITSPDKDVKPLISGHGFLSNKPHTVVRHSHVPGLASAFWPLPCVLCPTHSPCSNGGHRGTGPGPGDWRWAVMTMKQPERHPGDGDQRPDEPWELLVGIFLSFFVF